MNQANGTPLDTYERRVKELEVENTALRAAHAVLLLTTREIADLCEFTDAHESDGDTPIVVCAAPKERNCKHVAYFYEYPDEGAQCLGSKLDAAKEDNE